MNAGITNPINIVAAIASNAGAKNGVIRLKARFLITMKSPRNRVSGRALILKVYLTKRMAAFRKDD
jgi:hypothetical protein